MKQHNILRPVVALLTAAALSLGASAPTAFAQDSSDSASSQEYFEVAVASDANSKAWIQKEVTPGGQLRLRGEGWTNSAGDGGARVTVKLQTGPGEFIARTDNIQIHPNSGQEDSTIWAYVTPESNGDFDTELDLPDDIVAGQRLQVSLATGFGDPERSVVSPSLFIDGEQWVAEQGETTTCVPSTERAELSIPEGPDAENRIKIVGKGFCNNSDGASVVALKLGARGRYSRIDDEANISDNLSIWVVLRDEVDPETGDFEYWFTLPDGTTEKPNGSKPAFTEGEQSIIALTGSLKDDDPIRNVTATFDYGEYSPAAGAPEPPAYDDLNDDIKQDMQIHIQGEEAIVTLPHAAEGDFVFFTYFLTDTSQRLPWSDWYTVDANRQVKLDISGITRNGTYKLVAQSGNRGAVGEVRGWEWFEINSRGTNEPATDDPGTQADVNTGTYGVTDDGVAIPTGAVSRNAGNNENVVIVREPDVIIEETTTASAPRAATRSAAPTAQEPDGADTPARGSRPRPDFEPDAPFDKAWRLSQNNAGDVTSTADGEELIINVPEAEEGDWYFIWAYTPEPTAAGWLQTDDASDVRVDVSGLADGEYKFALIDEESEFIGWTGITLASLSEEKSGTNRSTSAAAEESSGMSNRDWWFILGALAIVLAGVTGVVIYQRRQQTS
ncbi:MAG: hypothetical protein Q3976_08140 [Corynebacterium sp.]|nr:hypothetical protein [Corynebacterium sp.]